MVAYPAGKHGNFVTKAGFCFSNHAFTIPIEFEQNVSTLRKIREKGAYRLLRASTAKTSSESSTTPPSAQGNQAFFCRVCASELWPSTGTVD